jgi:ammonia channel protein AmtB
MPTASKEVVDAMTAKAGLIWQWGALDFAGGTVVHINAAVAGLVGAYVIGKRTGYGKEAMAPHSLTLTMVGASLLWVGWFGFNAGSALEAGNSAVLAFMNTFSATAAAVLAWCLGEALMRGKASMLGAASGAVAGLVAITPACGNVGLMGAIIIGFVAGFACLWGVNGLKRMLGADDSLDVFGVHGVGGIVGALLTGVFNNQAHGRPWPGRRLGHCDGHLGRYRGSGLDPAQGGPADHRLVGCGVAHRLQDRRHGHRPARQRRRGTRRSGHHVPRRDCLQPLTGCGQAPGHRGVWPG